MKIQQTNWTLMVTSLFFFGTIATNSNAFLHHAHNQCRQSSTAFTKSSPPPPPSSSSSSSRLLVELAMSKKQKPAQTAEFEYQELKIQLDAMQKQGVVFSRLRQDKKDELEGYVRRIVNRRPSPVPLYELGNALKPSSSSSSNSQQWKLIFSNQLLTSESLPSDATIILKFINDKELEYSLEFGKRTMGLNRLTAKSTYTVDSGPVNPGLLTFVYQDITTDAFGLKNIGVGFFGLLQGRSNYIQTVYFDGQLWIERGMDVNGAEYFNVYVPPEKAEDDAGEEKGMWED